MELARHAWLFLLLGAFLNVWLIRRRIRPIIHKHPELAAGYRRLVRGTALWTSLPWLVMGVGCELGSVPSFVAYLFPATGGPFVWVFWGVVYGELLFLCYWSVWNGGGETLVRYPGITNFHAPTPHLMKQQLAWFAGTGLVWSTTFLIALGN
ncbi:Uncharacterized protein OS=Fluviicola taffensis (strain DSM 16823 / RW262 / RW262) GN=Fluta_2907 PE=4 SV=1 [Gemmata massiliana]|uniref:Uncharacterized protein n=1 Tax=Gemmata massiliana TaxID=1210884 RepID=A0A6P2DF07_9BACT|nr:hypothetical protein [Gemmata massiliana]VTS00220.1 Uncharacterized protein OS=Fluviicola taffensis (strain DSM 16823 / RW262 / RW262) GN=Fluta_2907 PE=4 SV=1 [Gemmata massiliana]